MTKPSLTLFDIVSKVESSNATVSELRVPIFSPIEKISHNSKIAINFRNNKGIRVLNTPWGESITRGRVLLGQQHRDILDCIYLNATRYEYTGYGSMKIFFCQRQVLLAYSGNIATGNYSWLRIKLEEIRDTSITFKNNQGDSFDFNIIKHLDYEASREMFCVELDERYVKFYAKDLSVNYQKLLPDIIGIKNSVLKAIVRFLLTHNHIKIGLMKTLATIGYPFMELSERNQREFIKEIRKHKNDLFDKFKIIYDEDFKTFEYSKHEDIIFIGTGEPIIIERQKLHKPLVVNDLLGKKITREFYTKGVLVTATICDIKADQQGTFTVVLLFPDGKILYVDKLFSSLEEIEKIIFS